MGSLVVVALLQMSPTQLGGCELWEEVVTHVERTGAWACIQQHNALGSDTALRNPVRVRLTDGQRTTVTSCEEGSKDLLTVWPRSKDASRIRHQVDVDAEQATITVGDTPHRLHGASAERLRAAATDLASCKRCPHVGFLLPSAVLIAVSVPVKDDCDGLVRRLELFHLPR